MSKLAQDIKSCDLILPHTDVASGQPEFKNTPVVVEPCGYRISSSKNPMELVIQFANTLSSLPRQQIVQELQLCQAGSSKY